MRYVNRVKALADLKKTLEEVVLYVKNMTDALTRVV